VPPAPSRAFPTPITSGRTTYAKRFDGGLTTGGRATAATGGTLGPAGTGSVTSAIEARRRALANEPRVRAPQSPGARFRGAAPETAVASRSLPAPSAKTRPGAEVSTHTEGTTGKSARRRATYDVNKAETNARTRRLLDPKAGRLVSTASGALATATGTLVSTATRPFTGGVSRLAGTDFGGYGTGSVAGTDFGGYGTGSGSGSGTGVDVYGNPLFGPTPSPYGSVGNFGYWDNGGYYHSPYSSWWGWSFGWSSGWGFYTGWNWGSPYCGSPYYPYGYYSPYSYNYPTVINHYIYEDDYGYDDDGVVVNVYEDGQIGEGSSYQDEKDTIINIYPDAVDADADANVEVNWLTSGEAAAAPASVGTAAGGAASALPSAAGTGTLGPAALRYLELGDAAFTEARFADAVHFYARSIEFEPDRGMLHLVLADALFATGDWHYAAYSIKKALELEPSLVESPVDKHQFYSDPTEFDRQLASLELYYKEHPTDSDARLVLALNQLFGARPEAAMQLLENAPTQTYGETDHAAALILESATRARWGKNPPTEATWKP